MTAFEAFWGKLYEGEALEVLRGLPDNSVDALISDPPAGISFMGLAFDSDRGGRDKWIAWLAEIMREAWRVVKPGGHALIWSLPRTSHWTAMALEDSGWLIKDCVAHIQAQGFPKGLNVAKAVEGLGEEAKQWQGWHTQLKPAYETWWLCQKPLSEGNVAKNVLKHGTGGLNIGATRIGAEVGLQRSGRQSKGITGGWANYTQPKGLYGTPDGMGRYPSHLILQHAPFCERVGSKTVKNRGGVPQSKDVHDSPIRFMGKERTSFIHYFDADGMETVEAWQCVEGCAVAELDRQSGERKAGGVVRGTEPSRTGANGIYGTYQRVANSPYQDTGGASRFFKCLEPEVPFVYMPKASRADREEGCDDLPEKACGMMEDDNYPIKTGSGNLRDTKRRNSHPTAKNTRLMQYLAKLICPPNGIILDCFMGSGSTGVAALREGFRFIGIEREPEYYAIARARILHEAGKPRQTSMLEPTNA